MVSFNESAKCIDEFWKLAYIKAGGDYTHAAAASQNSESTGHTLSLQESCNEYRPADSIRSSVHLMIVWFDVLLVQETSLLSGKPSAVLSTSQALLSSAL